MIVWGTRFCFLGQLTGLRFCLHINFPNFHLQLIQLLKQYFLHCTGKWVPIGKRFWANWYKRTKTQNKLFRVQESCTNLCGTVELWIAVIPQLSYLKTWKLIALQKRLRNAKLLTIYLERVAKKLDRHDCRKLKELIDPKKEGNLDLLNLRTSTQNYT